MRNFNKLLGAVATALMAASISVAPTAGATVVGPGDPIRIPTSKSERIEGNILSGSAMCSAGVPGTVTDPQGHGHKVLVTAGHCVNNMPGSAEKTTGTVFLAAASGDQRVGQTEKTDFAILKSPAPIGSLQWGIDTLNTADWGAVKMDDGVQGTGAAKSVDATGRFASTPQPLSGVKDYKDLGPNQFTFENFGQPICKDGNRTGRSCGVQVARAQHGVWSLQLEMAGGDSGGVAWDPETKQVIGMNSMAFGPVTRIQTADNAIEKAYGIPDGKVNERFQVADPAVHRDQPLRTMRDDVVTMLKHQDAQRAASPVAKAPVQSAKSPAASQSSKPTTQNEATGTGKVASAAAPAQVPAAVQAPQLPQVPQVPSSSQVEEQVYGAIDTAVPQALQNTRHAIDAIPGGSQLLSTPITVPQAQLPPAIGNLPVPFSS